MSEGLSVDFLRRVNARDVVPDHAKARDIKTSSLVTSRYTAKTYPQNGRSFGAGQVAYLRLNSTADYLVPSSGALFLDINVGADCALDEIGSFIDKVRINVGGVMVEELLYANKTINALATLGMSKEHYNREGSILYKVWKNSTCSGNTDVCGNLIEQTIEGVKQRTAFQATNVGGTKTRVVIPLSFLGGLFRSHKIFPLRNAGNIELQIFFAQPEQAVVCQTSATNPTYAIADMFCLTDMLCMNPRYVELMDQVIMSEQGMVLPVDTYTIQTTQQPLNSGGVQNFTYSFSSPMLKNIVYWSQLNTDNEKQVFSSSGFRNLGTQQTRLKLGKYYPNYDFEKSNEETYYMSQKSLGKFGNIVESAGLMALPFYNSADDVGQYVNEIPLGKYLEGAEIDLDGVDCRLSGSVINFEIQSNPPSGLTKGIFDTTAVPANTQHNLFVAFNHTRIVKMAQGNLMVEEA